MQQGSPKREDSTSANSAQKSMGWFALAFFIFYHCKCGGSSVAAVDGDEDEGSIRREGRKVGKDWLSVKKNDMAHHSNLSWFLML